MTRFSTASRAGAGGGGSGGAGHGLRGAALGMTAALLLSGAPLSALAGEVLVAAATIPAGVVIEPGHVRLADGEPAPGVLSDPNAAVGLEAKVALYKGKTIRSSDLGPRTVIRRNDVVALVFRRGALAISTEGRALEPGAVGDRIRIMNLDSRRTVYATVRGVNLAEVR
ncbi:MAG: flagellar basal body P-ring formation chaperone FlgA [Pseudomonadota bacterium]